MAKTNAARRRAFERRQEQERASRGCKKRGELAEMAFILKAERLGFEVSKPYGESNRYDFVVRSGQQFRRVQVKSCGHCGRDGYLVHVASDAVSSRSEWNWKIGLERMRAAGAVISSTEMMIYELMRSSSSAAFKELLPHLKG